MIDNYKLIENYFPINTNWDQAVNLLYKNAEGSQRPNTLWFKVKNRRLFGDLPDLKPFFEKINKDSDSEYYDECTYYDDWFDGQCKCKGIWHVDGPVISLDDETVSAHRDIHDAAYLQILGQSFWKLDGKETVVLNPGDLLLISKEITHEVWGQGPRMGILLMALKSVQNHGKSSIFNCLIDHTDQRPTGYL
jgi:hypothetical protein